MELTLTQVGRENFELVVQSKKKILEKVRCECIDIANYEAAAYFKGLMVLGLANFQLLRKIGFHS